MIFFRVETMSAPRLEVSAGLWAGLVDHLCSQGRGVRESGAFLLGRKGYCGRQVTGFLPYEELQSNALQEDYVSLSAASFSKLWAICREHGVSVVADVHTHRLGPQQSISDRTNPMIALKGHVGIIIPRFAQGKVRLEDIGVHVYLGNHQWESVFDTRVPTLISLVRP